jgi:hypothetical protein
MDKHNHNIPYLIIKMSIKIKKPISLLEMGFFTIILDFR